ncbi:antitoxin [Janibacter sp. GXQ6167]|uniref:antitoxin n=1 Tax=Janibacter sp. GXQ6167 TaxID=3240791 RepID=UPI003523B91D
MSMFDNLKDKAAEALRDNAEKVEELSDKALDKAEEIAESRGVGKDHVQQGRDFIDGKVGNENA